MPGRWRTSLWMASAATAAILAGLTPAARDLTDTDRAARQRAIEEVYWRHRTWPEANPGAKPPLEAIVPPAAMTEKVAESLKKSNALERFWGRPITGEMLQAEMDRMARGTRRPEVLAELWAALDNDPYLVAECLARPQLADRLLRNFFASDERVHDQVRANAAAELASCASPEALRALPGACEFEFLKGAAPGGGTSGTRAVALSPGEWEMAVQKLLSSFGLRGPSAGGWPSIPVGRVSGLLEEEDRFSAVAVLSAGPDGLHFVRVEWRKTPFDAWWKENAPALETALASPQYSYHLPGVLAGSCVDDSWGSISSMSVLAPRTGHTAVWTGQAMIVWGGFDGVSYLNDGASYDPFVDSWSILSRLGVPTVRAGHTAVWTGTEMIVWGGYDGVTYYGDGYRYDPSFQAWTPVSAAGAPTGRRLHTAVWANGTMIVWGGQNASGRLNTGGQYDPMMDTWTATSTGAGLPAARSGHTAVWTDSTMIVWGGLGVSGRLNTGGAYDPSANTWTGTSTGSYVPSARDGHIAVWTGAEMIVWGGQDSADAYLSTGSKYDPAAATWQNMPASNAPSARRDHTAVLAWGNKVLIWGGIGGNKPPPSYQRIGGIFKADSGVWDSTAMGSLNAPSPRIGHTAVCTGPDMIVWGGQNASGTQDTGSMYTASSGTWTPLSTTNGGGRESHTAVWTGNEMIAWGGFSGATTLDTGGIYNPATDAWTLTRLAGAPLPRVGHTAVWTGSEMIVWGGDTLGVTVGTDTGGRLNPATGLWTATSATGAPALRLGHTAVWSGSQMLIWGGWDYSTCFDTGGRYTPAADSWSATPTGGACPSGRYRHTAVWTNTEMIVWGGFDGSWYSNTGGRYNPAAGTWATTEPAGAPEGRESHSAVWTGSEMIVWGGFNGASLATGARYNPANPVTPWAPTPSAGAPQARTNHTAVWTGGDMFLWGGQTEDPYTPYLNSGGRYFPYLDAWQPVNTLAAPSERAYHTAVDAGDQVLVFGGTNGAAPLNSGGRYCALTAAHVSPVPDGRWVAGSPMLASKSGSEGVQLTFDVATCASANYQVFYGIGGNLPSYAPSGARCAIGSTGGYTWSDAPAVPPGERFIWWVLVGTDGAGTESSWGRDSAGNQRHPAASGLCSCTLKSAASTCP